MATQQILGPLTKQVNKELEARRALTEADSVDKLAGKQVLSATILDYESAPGCDTGVLLTFTDGTYVLIPSEYPDDLASFLIVDDDNPQQDVQLLVDSCLISPFERCALLEDIRQATEKHHHDQTTKKVGALYGKLSKAEKKALLKKLQEETDD